MPTPDELRKSIDADQEKILVDLARALQPHVQAMQTDPRGVTGVLLAASLYAFGDTIYPSLDVQQRRAFDELRKQLVERMKR